MEADALTLTIEEEVRRWPGVTTAPGRFGAVAFRYGKREIGHIHRDRIADLPYCMNVDCEASTEEARELEGMGYRNVRHYAEGKQDWMRAGLPVEGKRASERSRL